MNIRRLNKSADDLEKLGAFLMSNFAKEHQMGSLSAGDFDFEKGLKWVIASIECIAWVAEDEDNMIGSLGLYKTSPWYSDKPYLADSWFYVLPGYRRLNVGGALIKSAQKFAADSRLPLIINVFNMEETETKIQALQKMGLKLVGGTFMAGD